MAEMIRLVNLKAPAITAEDVEGIARRLGVDTASIRAVWEVETNGRPYDDKGRLAMLYEGHILWKLVSDNREARSTLAARGLAWAKWSRARYKGADSYQRLLDAADVVGNELALQSCSWGGPQIMGFNFKLAGHDSAEEMVTAFLESEGNQLAGFASFIVTMGLVAPLREKNWAAFARGYNGVGYRDNNYDVKLAKSYAKFRKKGL